MKHLLILSSSAIRNGNVAKLVNHIRETITANGEITCEHILIPDLDLKLCLGCHNCILKNESLCPLHDDRTMILKKMLHADGIILVTPVYCMSVSTHMKNLFDHLAFLWHRPRLFHKKVMVACVGAGAGPVAKPVVDYMTLNASRWGADVVSKIACVQFSQSVKQQVIDKQIQSINKVTRQFIAALFNEHPKSPSLSELGWFEIWRNSSKTQSPQSADHQYWLQQGWLDPQAHYYYKTDVNIFYQVLMKLFQIILYQSTKRTYTTPNTVID